MIIARDSPFGLDIARRAANSAIAITDTQTQVAAMEPTVVSLINFALCGIVKANKAIDRTTNVPF